MKNTYAAIMAGGIGSRFWPQSRHDLPKQFLDILGTGQTLLQMTFNRLKRNCPPENIYILTNESYRKIVAKQLPEIKNSQILGEPVRKNTAPTIAYFAYKIQKLNPKANMIISPSDHLVMNEAEFLRVSKNAIEACGSSEILVTLGIKPTRPDTGYGYIQYMEDEQIKDSYKVKTFTEKPSEKIAKTFVKSGDFLWNSGIFFWNVNAIVKSFETYLPEVAEAFSGGDKYYNTSKEKQFIEKAFTLCPNISIDFGIMEKADNVFVIPSDFGWSDLGTWTSLYDRYDKDYLGNAVAGKNVFIYDATNSMVMIPDEKLAVLQGLENFIVVDTPDVLLICHKDKEQSIKQMVNDIKRKKGNQFT